MEAIHVIRMIGEEFDQIDDEELQKWIELVAPAISKQKYGKLYDQALAYLVCHNLKLMGYGNSGSLPPIAESLRMSSMTAGKTSISFGSGTQAMSGNDGIYSLTVYGLQFLEIRKKTVIPILCSGMIM